MEISVEKIRKINRDTAAVISHEVLEALRNVEDRFGLKFQPSGGKLINASVADLYFRVSITDSESVEETRRAEFNQMCRSFGLLPKHYNTSFIYGGHWYRIVGFNPSRPKYCIRAIDAIKGREMLLTDKAIEHVKSFFKEED